MTDRTMTAWDAIRPLELSDRRKAMVSAHAYLRDLIYANVLPAGSIISQVELANMLGVSRTPLREALRMLQEEGLIVAEANRRCRIASFLPAELDSIYGSRMLLEALAMRITLPRLGSEDVAELGMMLQRLEAIEARDHNHLNRPSQDWLDAHRAYHLKMTSKAPDTLQEQLNSQIARSERYFVTVVSSRPFGSVNRHDEHQEIFSAIANGQTERAIAQTALHRARTAISLLTDAVTDFDPVTIRSALKMLAGDTRLPSNDSRAIRSV